MNGALTGSGFALVLLTLFGLATHLPGAGDEGPDPRQALFVASSCLATAVYFYAASVAVRHRQTPRTLWLVLGVAALLRGMVVAAPPFLSTDLYRYIWDGRVQLAGGNPYAQLPADPALAALRDAAIYPNINRADYAPTIYPPAAQLVFRAVAWIGQTPLAERLAMVLFECIALAAVIRLLDQAALDRSRILVYAWNPLSVWEFAGNGHIDAASTAFVALALLVCIRGWRAATGVLLACAALVKVLPVALAPALWPRRDWRMPAAMLATAAVLYAIFIDAGWKVVGFLWGYATEEGLGSGTGIFWLDALAHVVVLPAAAGRIWLAAAAVALALLAIRIAFSPGGSGVAARCRDIVILGTAVIAAITPHYPWYFVWLAIPCCVAPYASVIYLSAAAVVQYHNPVHDTGIWFGLIYVPFAVLALRDLMRAKSAVRS